MIRSLGVVPVVVAAPGSALAQATAHSPSPSPAPPPSPASSPPKSTPTAASPSASGRHSPSRSRLRREAGKRMAMQKDASGVWTVTSDPLEPDVYGYAFVVDGVDVLDPFNAAVIPNLLNKSSLLHVPGPSATTPWERADTPRGVLHRHFYKSAVVGDERDFYVYTPPGYDPHESKRYPVLYLLHGFSDDASAWTAVGRAHVILDNLIASGKAKPMLVVMPLGYGAPEFVSRGFGAFRDMDLRKRNYDRFRDALLTEVVPAVESAYRAAPERESRAIAGLSMGGAESLYVGPQRPRPLRFRRRLQLRRPSRRPRRHLRRPRRQGQRRACACCGSPAAPRTGSSRPTASSTAGWTPRACGTPTSRRRARTPGWCGGGTWRPWCRCSSSGGARPGSAPGRAAHCGPSQPRSPSSYCSASECEPRPSPPPSIVMAGMPRLDGQVGVGARRPSAGCEAERRARLQRRAHDARRLRAGCRPGGSRRVDPHRSRTATAASARARRRAHPGGRRGSRRRAQRARPATPSGGRRPWPPSPGIAFTDVPPSRTPTLNVVFGSTGTWQVGDPRDGAAERVGWIGHAESAVAVPAGAFVGHPIAMAADGAIGQAEPGAVHGDEIVDLVLHFLRRRDGARRAGCRPFLADGAHEHDVALCGQAGGGKGAGHHEQHRQAAAVVADARALHHRALPRDGDVGALGEHRVEMRRRARPSGAAPGRGAARSRCLRRRCAHR